MTFNEMVHQIYNLPKPLPCYINGVRFTSEKELRTTFKAWLRKQDDQFIYEQCLLDGRWFCKAVKRGDYYDYIVPDTREQEHKFIVELFPNA